MNACPACGEEFPGEAVLDRHMQVEHPDDHAAAAQAHDQERQRKRQERTEQERLRDAIPVRPEERRETLPNGSETNFSSSNLDLLRRLTGEF